MRRVLIDECINPRLARRLRDLLPDDSVDTLGDLGWSGQKDHVIVPKVQGRFDVFVTIDKGFEFDLRKLAFGIIVIQTTNNQMPSYERLMQDLVRLVGSVAPGTVVRASDPEF